jgi:hypothetical protein
VLVSFGLAVCVLGVLVSAFYLFVYFPGEATLWHLVVLVMVFLVSFTAGLYMLGCC